MMADMTVRQIEDSKIWSLTFNSPESVNWARLNIPQWHGRLDMAICGSWPMIFDNARKAREDGLTVNGIGDLSFRVVSFACEQCGHVHTATEGLFTLKRYSCSELGDEAAVACIDQRIAAHRARRLMTAGNTKRRWYDEQIALLQSEKENIMDRNTP